MRLKKALSLYVVAEVANAAIIICVIVLLSSLGPRDIISDSLGFFLNAFWVLSLCSLVFVANRYSVGRAAGSLGYTPIELLEAEVDASTDKSEGLDYVVSYIRTHYRTPETLLYSFLHHMALRDDDAGKRAREVLNESKSS